MLANLQTIRSRIVRTKAATIADWDEMEQSAGTWSFDATGIKAAASTSNRVTIQVGGFGDQKITAVLSTTTTPGSESFGVIARFITNETGAATYYYLRQNAGVIRLQKVVDGVFTTLASSAYTIVASTEYTFTLQVVGSALTASITDGVTTVELTATDSAVPAYGSFGFRSGPTLSTQIACKNWQVEEPT